MDRAPVDWSAVEHALGPSAQTVGSFGGDAGRRSGGALPTPSALPGPEPVASRPLLIAATVGLGGLALAAVVGLFVASSPAPAVLLPADAARSEAAASGAPLALGSEGGLLVIDVEGGVRRPGLYRLPPGSRVADAVAAAGGFGPSVDVAAARATLNLADTLQDGAKVLVPERGTGPTTTTTGTAASAKVDLNRAGATELDALPGVGPVTAAKIIASRQQKPFRSIEELRTRKLVGAATFEKLKGLVTVGR